MGHDSRSTALGDCVCVCVCVCGGGRIPCTVYVDAVVQSTQLARLLRHSNIATAMHEVHECEFEWVSG